MTTAPAFALRTLLPHPSRLGWRAALAVLGLGLAQAASAQPALDLYAAWQHAFSYDPNYRAALSEFSASQAQKNISRAGLLPQISGGYSDRRISGWRERPERFGALTRTDLSYDSTNLYAQLRQPLLNYPRWAEYRRGVAVAAQGAAQLDIAQQQNSLQVTQSYFNVILAYVDHEEQTRREAFLAQRVTTFEQLLAKDEITMVELAETQARLATASAEQLQAFDELRNAARQLQAHIGFAPRAIKSLDMLNPPLPLTTPLSELQAQAQAHNKEIKSAQQQVAMAQARLESARSRYFPSLDLVATAGRGDSEDIATLSQRTNTFTVGLQLQVPLFTGGYTRALSTQARYQLEQAEYLYRNALNKVDTQVARLYQQYQSGIEQVAAQYKAYRSSQLSLESALQSFAAGAISNLDVLEAQEQLSNMRYEYYQRQLELVQSQLELAAVLGESLHTPIQQLSQVRFENSATLHLDTLHRHTD